MVLVASALHPTRINGRSERVERTIREAGYWITETQHRPDLRPTTPVPTTYYPVAPLSKVPHREPRDPKTRPKSREGVTRLNHSSVSFSSSSRQPTYRLLRGLLFLFEIEISANLVPRILAKQIEAVSTQPPRGRTALDELL